MKRTDYVDRFLARRPHPEPPASASAKAATPGGIVDLSESSPAMPVHSQVIDGAAKALREGGTHYTPFAGIPALTQAIAGLLAADKIEVDPTREVIATSSAEEALYLALQTFVRPGDEVLTTDPCAAEILRLIHHLGGVVRRVESRAAPDFSVSFDALAAAISAQTKVAVLGVPSDPTGRAPVGNARSFEQRATSMGAVVVLDERYKAFLDSRQRHESPLAHPPLRGRAIIVRDLTAAYGLDCFPCGVVAGPAQLVHPMRELKQIISICSPSVSQFAALTAIRQLELGSWPSDLLVDLEWLAQELTARGFSVAGPPAGPWLLASDGRPALAQRLLGVGIRVVDGGRFGATTAGWVRVTWAPRHDLLTFLERLPAPEARPA